MDEQLVIATTCAFCTKTDTKVCERCNKNYCPDHVSKISPIFCCECFSKITLVIESLTKRDSEWDMFQDCLVEHKSSARTLRLDGPDWVWYSKAMNTLTSDEFKTMFEFHRFIISLMEHIQDVRKVEKNASLKEAKTTVGVTTTTTTTKTVKKSRQISIEEVLRKQGLPEAMIQSMLAAVAKGQP